jgi:hypothetical protein
MHKINQCDVLAVVMTRRRYRAFGNTRRNPGMMTMAIRLVAILTTMLLCFQHGNAQECAVDGTCDTHERW